MKVSLNCQQLSIVYVFNVIFLMDRNQKDTFCKGRHKCQQHHSKKNDNQSSRDNPQKANSTFVSFILLFHQVRQVLLALSFLLDRCQQILIQHVPKAVERLEKD